MFSKHKITRTTRGLREALFEELEAIQSGKSNTQRATAVSKVASQILTSVKLDMDYHRFVKQEQLSVKERLSYLEIGEK